MKKMKSFITGTVALSMVLTTLLPTTALAAVVHDEVAESEVVEDVASTVSDAVDTAGDTVQDVVDSIPTYTVPEVPEDAPTEEEEVPSETPEEEPEAEEPETSVEVTTKTSEDEMSDVVSAETESHTRLFVMSEEELTEFYGASSVDYYEGVYAITYADAETCMKAFSSFMAAGRTVEYDDSVEAFNEEIVEDKTTVSEEVTSIEDNNVTSDETTTEVVEDVTTVEEHIDTTKQRQIRVALIDTGVDTTNETLQGHIAEGYDASNMSDVNGHGTLMAEIIASNTNENVKIVPYQVFNENGKATVGATYYALLKAINEQVDVISLSVSGYGTSNMLTSAIAKAKEAGIYVVVAAGNDGDNADEFMPGNISDTIAVSAISIGEDGNKTLATYSNHGSVVDYSALGTIVKDKGTEDVSDDEVYEGTSISAANVSSYIATMLQYIKDDESTENDEVLDALNSTIEDLGEAGRDDSFGVGYLSFEGIQKYISDKAQLEEIEESSSNEEDATENDDTTAIEESAEEYPDEEVNQTLNVAMTKKTFSIELQNFRAGGYLELWGGEDVFTNGVPTDIKNLGEKVTYTFGAAGLSYNWPAGGTFTFSTSGNTVYVSMNNVDVSNTTPYLAVHFGNNSTNEFYATQKLTYGASGSTGAKQYDSNGNFKYDITANNANAQRVAPTIVGQCDLFTYIGEAYSISAWRCNRIKYTAKWENWVDSDTNEKVNEVTDCEATIGFTINISGDVDTVKSVTITSMSGSTAKPTVSSPFNGTIYEVENPSSADVGNGIQRKKDGKTLYCTTLIEDLFDYTTYDLKYTGKIKIKIRESGQSADTTYSNLEFTLPDKSFTTKTNSKIEDKGGKYTLALQLLRKAHTYSAITIDADGTIGISKDNMTIGGAAKDSTVNYTYKGTTYKCTSYSNANNLTINYSGTTIDSKIKFTESHYISIPAGKTLKVNGKKETDGTFITSIASDSTVFSSSGSLEVSKTKLAGGNNKPVIDSKTNSSLAISNSEIKNYSTDSKGSYGIKNAGTATLSKCTIHGNSSGGIHNSGTMTVGGGLADMRIYGNGGYGIVNSGTINATALSLGFSSWTSQSAFAISTNHGGINNSGTFNATENIRIYQNGTAHGINNSGTFNNKLANYANGTAPSINIYKSRTSGVADDTGISIGYQNTAGGKYVDSSTTTATPLIIMGIMKEGVHNAGPNTEKNLPGGSFSAKKVTINGNYCLASGNTAWSTTTSNGISSNGVWNGGSMNLPSVSITGTGTSADGLENAGTITNISGSIIGGKIGVYNESGTIGTLSGTVTSTASDNHGVSNVGTITTLSATVNNMNAQTGGHAIHNAGTITTFSGKANSNNDTAVWNGKETSVIGTFTGTATVSGTAGYGINNCNASAKINNLSANITGTTTGINNDGTIVHKSGTATGSTWGLKNSGTYTQTGGKIVGSSANTSGSNGGVYQNGTYKVSGSATVSKGDVYLTKGHYIEVNGALTSTTQVANVDTADKTAGNVLVKVTYQSGNAAESTCDNLIKSRTSGSTIYQLFDLSKNLKTNAVVTTSAPTAKDVDAEYNYNANDKHTAAISAGRGSQAGEIENPEVIDGISVNDYTNGAQGTLILSCWLDVSYDTEAIEEITGLDVTFENDNDDKRDNIDNKNLFKEGFASSDADKTKWNTYKNNTDWSMVLTDSNTTVTGASTYGSAYTLAEVLEKVGEGESLQNLLVVGKTYGVGNENNSTAGDSYVFLGWCLDKDGNGEIYDSPTSFPIGNNYTWYPIFDIKFGVTYKSNFTNPNHTDLGGNLNTTVGGDSEDAIKQSVDNSTDGLANIQESSYTIAPDDNNTQLTVLGNTGADPNHPIENYFGKEIQSTRYDYNTETDEDYTYQYSFQGWSLNKNSTYANKTDTDSVSKTYTPEDGTYCASASAYVSGNAIVNNDARLSRWSLYETAKDTYGLDTITVNGKTYACIVMYAIWDEYPVFEKAEDIAILSSEVETYSADRILEDIVAVDLERKSETGSGVLTNGTEVEVLDFDLDELKELAQGKTAATSVTLQATDSAGNVTKTRIYLWINQVKPVEDIDGFTKDGYTRFVSADSYAADYENGGLYPTSLWLVKDEYVDLITSSFDNLANDTPVESWYFTHEDVLATQDFIDSYGIGKAKHEDGLTKWYQANKQYQVASN